MQQRINLVLIALVVLLGIGLAASVVLRPAPGLDQAEVRALVRTVLAEQETPPVETTALAADQINPLIESYLLDNPRILERMSMQLEAEIREEEMTATRLALEGLGDQIYDDPDNIILGNPDGDVTLVELFDYNCGYCRNVLPDIVALIDEDPDLRVILKEFPILSQGSLDAARVGVLVARDDDTDYMAFHQALFTERGGIDGDKALAVATDLGLNRVSLELDMQSDDVTGAIQRTYSIAQALNVSGTPTFIIGNEVIPGAVSKAQLQQRIANMRACGETICADGG